VALAAACLALALPPGYWAATDRRSWPAAAGDAIGANGRWLNQMIYKTL
jgi:hypothetical protein